MLLAVAVMLATPEALVTAVPLDNTALAPSKGVLNATVTPITGSPLASLTVTWSGFGKGKSNRLDCSEPPVAVILAATPDVLVSEKVAESVPTLAVTA